MPLLNWVLIDLHIALSMTCAGHALFFKKTPAAALAWVSVCLIFPFAGPFFYFLFGINRVRTRARKLDDERQVPSGRPVITPVTPEFSGALYGICKISNTVTRLPMVSGNHIDLLHTGEAAYPAMIETIESAHKRIFLASYIFDTSPVGMRFIEALTSAVKRGVIVRVIIDGVGELYSVPKAGTLLEKNGVKVARYLPPRYFPPMLNINLRNHRKLLVADGDTGYTGGMNIREKHLEGKKAGIIDTHFRLTGPITRQLEHSFIEDWAFCAGEDVQPSSHPAPVVGNAICRVITDGPNEDIDKLEAILVGAVTAAETRVIIMTPYFLPSLEMMAALRTAVLKGIAVDIVLPEKNNLPVVKWAMNHMLSDFLKQDVRVFYQPPPFVHSKLFVVDEKYAQIGSANIDPRSLRLNFELNVEIYDPTVAKKISSYIEKRIAISRKIELKDIRDLPIMIKTRDALAWLFSPYL
ncbi:MAG: cardiolipin synthase [Deltaproteobacteria bacterium]|nr:cardiolipin synthase [Deltaproteobacteria bacterium]